VRPKVALTRTGTRSGNIETGLQLIESEIDLRDKTNVFVKVNFVSTRIQLAATHVDAVRPLLHFLRKRYDGKITIAESSVEQTLEGFTRFNYLDLVKEFDVEIVDLNRGEWEVIELYNSSLRPMKLRFSKQLAESDYRIIIGPAKTHDTVVVTLSIKNLAMGGLKHGFAVWSDKRKMHQGYPVHNLNLYLLARAYPPHLSIIDGYVGMEGSGPVGGTLTDWGVSVASTDPVAADCLAAQLMGFNISDIGYLWYCHQKGLGTGDMNQMDILGADPQDCYHQFRPHPTNEAQKHWRDRRISELLGLSMPVAEV